MFEIGQLIHYGSTGVCRVDEIRDVAGAKRGESRRCYILQPLYQSCRITTPVDNDKVFMRPIISRDEAERLIGSIPSIHTEEYHSRATRELAEHYQQSLESHSCEDLLELTMSIYSKRKTLESQKKKFGVIDERFMKRGEELLFGELAAALEMPKEQVPDYIASRLGRV